MRENNSVPLMLEFLQRFCKINIRQPWTAKVYTRTYHRLIWRFSVFLQLLWPLACRGYSATAPCASLRLVARNRTRWKTIAHLDVAASMSRSRCGLRPARLRAATRFSKAHIRNRRPYDAGRSSVRGAALDRSDSFQGECY